MGRQNPPSQASSETLLVEDTGASSDSTSVSEQHALGDSNKPIPFLRRLRDMLVENEDSISFVPGRARTGESLSLGRIIVHDRIKLEANVLPKYFNHSSFASLRRQLNYFKFVRLGKGRQLESTYVNDGVVELNDVLALKRRSTTANSVIDEQQHKQSRTTATTTTKNKRRFSDTLSESDNSNSHHHRHKARLTLAISKRIKGRTNNTATATELLLEAHVESSVAAEAASSVAAAVEEEDVDLEHDNDRQELLAGCQALLGLSGKEWNPYYS